MNWRTRIRQVLTLRPRAPEPRDPADTISRADNPSPAARHATGPGFGTLVIGSHSADAPGHR